MWRLVAILVIAGCGRLGFELEDRRKGALPDGAIDDAASDIGSPGGDPTLQLACGTSHCCLKKLDGSVSCWGSNTNGQLGDGTQVDSPVPVRVMNLNDAVSISAGNDHTCAVRAITGNNLVCWGLGNSNQLGSGTGNSLVPVVAIVSGVTSVAAGATTTCAGHANGTAHCWGYNYYANIGSGSGVLSSTPTLVPGLTDITTMTVSNFTCALRQPGGVSCWAYNEYGSVGDGRTLPGAAGEFVASPTAVVGLTDAVQISSGFYHTCVKHLGGGASCWGLGTSGQLGVGDQVTRSSPIAVTNLTDVGTISVGGYTSCALKTDGHVECWGNGNGGQIGNGGTANALVPNQVAGLTDAVQVAVGGFSACALRQAGQVVCWGSNTYGQVGNGATGGNVLTPTSVVGL